MGQSAPSSDPQGQQGQSPPDLPDHPELDSPPDTFDEVATALEAVENGTDGGDAADSKKAPEKEKDSPPSEPERKPPEDKVRPSALAAFHRQQKELFQREREFKAKEAEYQRITSLLENAKSDRLAALELMGYKDPREFLESIAQDGGKETPERRQIRELQKWKEDQEKQHQEQMRQWQAQQQQQQVQSKLDALKAKVQDTLKSVTYRETVLALDGADEVILQQMDRMATESGEIPRIEDAIKVVEAKFRSNLEKMLANPEVASFFREKLPPTKSHGHGTPQSKQRARTGTIGAEARTPGTRIGAPNGEVPDDDQIMAEALSFLKSRTG